ncbi:MAG: hypothetical protein ABSA62_15870 [Methyloceanibacter sp.]
MTLEKDDRSGWDLRRWPIEFGAWSVPSLYAQASRSSRVRLLILAALALFLVWEVLTRSLAAYFADADPEAALRLRSTNPTALLNLAEDRLAGDEAFKSLAPVLTPPRSLASSESSHAKGGESSQNLDVVDTSQSPSGESEPAQSADQAHAQISSWAELALLQDPLNARAFRILGQISDLTSDAARTEALMQAAVRRSLLESVAVYWMMRKSYQDQDYRTALRYGDTLLRTRSQVLPLIMPMFGKIAETPDASDELKQLLARNPNWRGEFFGYLPASISDARTPLEILLSLKDTPTPPTAQDLSAYLNFLIQHGFYDLAYYTWLQFMPPEQLAKAGHLFNGSFDIVPSGMPFDWVFTKGSGVTIQIAAPNDQPGGRALFLEFGPGRVDYREVTQLILLGPGSYKFRGKYKADLVSQRGLEWHVACAGAQATPIGQSPAVKGSTPGWTEFEFSFTVPKENCPAQFVRLVFDARSDSERFISGSIWYDDLQIGRGPMVDSTVEQ